MTDSGRLFDIESQSCLAELRPIFAPVSCFIGHTTWNSLRFSPRFPAMKEHIVILVLLFTYSTLYFDFYV